MFTKYTKITRDIIGDKECIVWLSFVEDVAVDQITALVTPSGLMMLEGHSTIKKERAAGVMLELARWNRRSAA
jgi:hypothetical protein